MGIFLSTVINRIDRKGRVSVPASFREALAQQSFHGIVVFRSYVLETLEGFGMDRIERLSKDLDRFDYFSQEQNDLVTSIFADVQRLAFDSEGRVVLPKSFCDHAHLGDQVAFVGQGATFQLWNPQKFQAHQEEARKRLSHQKKGGHGNDRGA